MHYLILERLLQDGPSHALEALGGRSADVDDLAFVFVPRNRMANPSCCHMHRPPRSIFYSIDVIERRPTNFRQVGATKARAIMSINARGGGGTHSLITLEIAAHLLVRRQKLPHDG